MGKAKIVPDAKTAEGGGPASPPLFWLMTFGLSCVKERKWSSPRSRSYADSVERGKTWNNLLGDLSLRGICGWLRNNRKATFYWIWSMSLILVVLSDPVKENTFFYFEEFIVNVAITDAFLCSHVASHHLQNSMNIPTGNTQCSANSWCAVSSDTDLTLSGKHHLYGLKTQ